jgi:hypothetical protein
MRKARDLGCKNVPHIRGALAEQEAISENTCTMHNAVQATVFPKDVSDQGRDGVTVADVHGQVMGAGAESRNAAKFLRNLGASCEYEGGVGHLPSQILGHEQAKASGASGDEVNASFAPSGPVSGR